MKKVLSIITVGLVFALMFALVGFTDYKADKLYSERQLPSYSSKDEVSKNTSITRKEAIKISKDALEKGFSIKIDNLGLKQNVNLNKSEGNNKFNWDITWGDKKDSEKYNIVINCDNGKIEKISVESGIYTQEKGEYNLSESEVNEILNNSLKLINKNVKDYKMIYNVKGAKFLMDSETGEIKELMSFSSDNKKGYNRYTSVMVDDKNVVIDCKEKKVVSCSF